MNKGQITLTIGTVIAVGTIAVSGLTSYFTNNLVQAEKLSEVEEKWSGLRTLDLQRTSTMEEAIGTIKVDNAEMKRDIKEILRLLK